MVSLTNVNKNITALTVKEHKLSYVVRMRETESLKGGGGITELHAWNHPEEKSCVFVVVGSCIGFFSLLQEQTLP